MRKIFVRAAIGLALAASSLCASADESTGALRIDYLFFNGLTNEFYAFTTTKLGIPSCPDANALAFSAIPQGAQRAQMIELIKEAKLHARPVSVQGNCAPNPVFFSVTRMTLR